MKKVLFLIPTLGYGGAERVLVNLVNNMDHDKFDITVQTLFDEGIYRDKLSDKVHYKTTFFKKQFRGNTTLLSFIPARLLYRLIVKGRYDFIVSYLEGPATHILTGCKHKETKRIAWVHIELNSGKLFKQGFKTKKEAVKAYKSFDKVVFVADSVRKAFENCAGVMFSNTQVLYNTNETEQIRTLAMEPVSDIAFDRNTVNVFSVAKLMHSKGFDRLVRVHKRLLDEGLAHRIYILGEGEKRQELENYISENRLEETFVLLGFKENPYKYLSQADIYVCSSRREGFSTAVTEALVLGKPVVSTCCSGAYELLGDNNEYGIVVENSTDGIYEGLKTMLEDSELRKKYAEAAATRGKTFSKDETVRAVEEMLISL